MAKQQEDKPVEMVTVKAIAEGYDNIAVRQPGDVFEMPKSTLGRKDNWFVPVEPD